MENTNWIQSAMEKDYVGGVSVEKVKEVTLESVERWVYWSRNGHAVPPQDSSVIDEIKRKIEENENLTEYEQESLKMRLQMELQHSLKETLDNFGLDLDVICDNLDEHYVYSVAIKYYCM